MANDDDVRIQGFQIAGGVFKGFVLQCGNSLRVHTVTRDYGVVEPFDPALDALKVDFHVTERVTLRCHDDATQCIWINVPAVLPVVVVNAPPEFWNPNISR